VTFLEIIKTYIEGEYRITEFSKNGVDVTHTIKQIIQSGEPPIRKPTTDERIQQLQQDNETLMLAMSDLYMQVLKLKGDA
jgi:hypothetical protein